MQQTMKHFDDWYGPYPYKQITVVDPGDLRAGGMEYPTLITGDTTWWMPEGFRFVEQVVEHEFGHQYWYGMVATNEFEDAWLDEGINSYTECKILDDISGKDTSGMDLWGLTESDDASQRNGYLSAADLDPMARFAYQYIERLLVWRHYLRQDGDRPVHAGEGNRRGNAQTRHSHLLPAVPFYSSHQGRLPEDDRRSQRTEPALVLRPGGVRHAGAGL